MNIDLQIVQETEFLSIHIEQLLFTNRYSASNKCWGAAAVGGRRQAGGQRAPGKGVAGQPRRAGGRWRHGGRRTPGTAGSGRCCPWCL